MTKLRSDKRYAGGDRNAYLHRAWMRRGVPSSAFVDGLVLLGGCNKTIPALLMAAASVDLPAVVISGGPMLVGSGPRRPGGLARAPGDRLDAAAEELVPHAAGRPAPVGSGCRVS
jgi:dihydroxyacid dehydratase/phosphogluconate dehydratase